MTAPRKPNPRYGQRPPLTAQEAFETRDDYDLDAKKSPWRRQTPPSDDDGMDVTDVIEAVYSNPDLYALAERVPARSKKKPGCPADYPAWAMVGYGALVSQYGSARATHLALRVSHNWDIVLRTVAATAGQAAVDALRPKARSKGPTRNHWNYWTKVNNRFASQLEAAYLPLAVAQAQEQGLLDPELPVSYARPDQRSILYGDGKVMTGPVRPHEGDTIDPDTGERLHGGKKRRTDPASALWIEGGDDGDNAYGTKFVFTSVRGPGFYNKVALAMDKQVKGGRGEMEIGTSQMHRIIGQAGTGVRAVAWDGAMSGVHIDALMREHGLVVVSPTIAKQNPDGHRAGHKSKTRVEKEHPYGTLEFRSDKGPCEHELHTRGGRLGQVVTDTASKRTWVPLRIDKLTRGGAPGSYRFYQELTIACPTNDDEDTGTLGSHTYRLPLVESDKDTASGFNRSEYLRQIPPDTKAYARAYGRRPPAESDNAQRESRYVFHRLPAYGEQQQTLVMLLGSLLDNSKSRWHHRRRQQDEAEAA